MHASVTKRSIWHLQNLHVYQIIQIMCATGCRIMADDRGLPAGPASGVRLELSCLKGQGRPGPEAAKAPASRRKWPICIWRARRPAASIRKQAQAGRPQPAGERGSSNRKLVTNRHEIIFYQNLIRRGVMCTSVSAPIASKDTCKDHGKGSVLSMGMCHALEGPKV